MKLCGERSRVTSVSNNDSARARTGNEQCAGTPGRIWLSWIALFWVAGAMGVLNACGGVSSSPAVTQTGNQDFEISAPSLSPATISAGSKAISTITITPENGFNATVTLACSGLPGAATCSFNPSSVAGSGTSQLTVTTTTAVVPGRYAFTVSGSSSNLNHNAQLALGVALENGLIDSNYFGIHGHHLPEGPWSQVAAFTATRLWGTGTTWNELQPTDGPFNWKHLDDWMQTLQENGVTHVLFELSGVAHWASSDSNNTNCDFAPVYPPKYYGYCAPPSDLNSDGTGPDQYWRNWVAAVAQRLQSDGSTYGITIDSYEPWNEFTREASNLPPGSQLSWEGTNQQLVRMVQDARCIIVGNLGGSQTTEASGGQTCAQVLQSVNLSAPVDPSALFLSPSTGIGGARLLSAWDSYMATPGAADAADGYAPHLYKVDPSLMPPETMILQDLQAFESDPTVAAGVQNGKPVWATEGSWLKNSDLPDPDDQAAYLAREFLFLFSTANIPRYYWYSLDQACNTPGCDNVSDPQGGGTLMIPPGVSACTSSNGCVQEPGIAYGQVFKWMVGATQTTPCNGQGTIWTCFFTRPSPAGYQAEAIWDISQTCSPTCTTTPVVVSSTYVQYRDLSGNVTQIVNNTVPVGEKPILLENQ